MAHDEIAPACRNGGGAEQLLEDHFAKGCPALAFSFFATGVWFAWIRN
jgi:hypothetical protein